MITTLTITRVLKCDCHGNQTMAKVENGNLIIEGIHHSSFHKIIVPLDILVALYNTQNTEQKN